MFNTLYRCQLTIARHESGPLAESRRCFLEYLAEEGASRNMLRDTAATIYRAAVMLKITRHSVDTSSAKEPESLHPHDRRGMRTISIGCTATEFLPV